MYHRRHLSQMWLSIGALSRVLSYKRTIFWRFGSLGTNCSQRLCPKLRALRWIMDTAIHGTWSEIEHRHWALITEIGHRSWPWGKSCWEHCFQQEPHDQDVWITTSYITIALHNMEHVATRLKVFLSCQCLRRIYGSWKTHPYVRRRRTTSF